MGRSGSGAEKAALPVEYITAGYHWGNVCFLYGCLLFFISGITGFAGFKTAPLFLYSDSAAVSAEISETL